MVFFRFTSGFPAYVSVKKKNPLKNDVINITVEIYTQNG